MSGGMALCILAMLERGSGFFVDILIKLTSESCRHYLYATADSKDGYLTVGSEAYQKQFLAIAGRIDGTEFADWFLVQVKGVDVASTREDKCVYMIEQAHHSICVLKCGDDNRCATSFQH